VIEFFRKSKLIFFLACVAYLFLLITNGVPYIYADGFYYFHIAKSLVTQGSFVSQTKPEYYDYSAYAVAEYGGKFVEVVAPGTSLFLAPGLFVANALRNPYQSVQNEYFLAFNGHTLPDGIAILLTTMVISLISVYLLYRGLLKFGYSRAVATSSVLTGYLSSYAVWYVFLEPAYSHSYEFFGISLLLFGLAGYFQLFEKKYLFAVGIALGILFLIRPPYALVAVLVGLVFLWRRNLGDLVRIVGSALPFLGIWLVYNFVSYGSFLTTGYSQIRGENFVPQFNLVQILFSLERGWFVYSPLLLVGAIGLILWWKRSAMLAFIFTGSVLSVVLTYSFWGAWWGGYGFGQRFLLGVVPIMIVGLAEVLNYLRRSAFRNLAVTVLALLVLWSLTLTVLYRFTPVTQLRQDAVGSMQAVDRYTPFDMFDYHRQLLAKNLAPAEYAQALLAGANGGESILIYLLGWSDRVVRLDSAVEGEISLNVVYPERWVDSTRVGQLSGYLAWQGKVYHVVFDAKEGAKIVCATVCTSESIRIEETTEFPKKLKSREYSCFEFVNGQRLCLQVAKGNSVKGPKTQYSKQTTYSLLG
jgi:hypothetical protein